MVVNLVVKDFGDFEFQFIVDYDWWGWGLNIIGNWNQGCWFQLGNMENWVYSVKTVHKS